jgi:acetylornithine deacetylase/succinyl-diaminopimelate desuccinylase-like protein
METQMSASSRHEGKIPESEPQTLLRRMRDPMVKYGKTQRRAYRLQPMEFAIKDTAMVHGTNEHLALKNLQQCVQFYARLIATAAS